MRPLTEFRFARPWSAGRQNGLVLNLRLCDIRALLASKSDIKSHHLSFKIVAQLLGFKSKLYLILCLASNIIFLSECLLQQCNQK